jgi:hypothetical protein
MEFMKTYYEKHLQSIAKTEMVGRKKSVNPCVVVSRNDGKINWPPAAISSGVLLNQGCQTPIYKTTDSLPNQDPHERKPNGLQYFLPKAEITIVGKYEPVEKGSEEKKFVITKTKTCFPDANAERFTEIVENVFYDEDTKITVQNGLLSSSNTKPKDQAPEIIKTVVSAVLNAGGLNPSGLLPGTDLKSKSKREFGYVFDPFVPHDRKNIGGYLLTVEVGERNNVGIIAKEPSSGLAFRPLVPVTVRLRDPNNESFVDDQVFLVPDTREGSERRVPVTRKVFTQRETEVVFTNGSPEQIHLKQPSPVLAIARLPLDLIKAVGDALPAIVKVQYPDKTVAKFEALKAENAILEQKIKQVEMDNKLRSLQVR